MSASRQSHSRSDRSTAMDGVSSRPSLRLSFDSNKKKFLSYEAFVKVAQDTLSVKYSKLRGLRQGGSRHSQCEIPADDQVVPLGEPGEVAKNLRQLCVAVCTWYRREYTKAERGAPVGAKIIIDAHLLGAYTKQIYDEANSIHGSSNKSQFAAAASSVPRSASRPPQ